MERHIVGHSTGEPDAKVAVEAALADVSRQIDGGEFRVEAVNVRTKTLGLGAQEIHEAVVVAREVLR